MSKLKIKILFFIEKIRTWFERLRQNRDLIVFLVFLVIATAFWFLNALRKDYTATLSYPVRFVNIPEGKMLSDDFKGRIQLKVRSRGFVILRYQLSNTFLPLTLDVSEMKSATNNDFEGVYKLINEDRNRIVGQLSQGMELIEIEPDTLFVPLIEHARDLVPVNANTRISFEKQYLQAGPVIVQPDSVEVSGPRDIIDTMRYVSTRQLVFDDLSDTVSTSVQLILPNQVEASERRVSVTVPVQPFSEMNLRVPLKINGLPDSLRIKTFPSEIQVSFRVGISEYEDIDKSQFRAVVDVAPVLSDDRPERLKVRLDRVPPNIESLSFSPIFVEYILEKKR